MSIPMVASTYVLSTHMPFNLLAININDILSAGEREKKLPLGAMSTVLNRSLLYSQISKDFMQGPIGSRREWVNYKPSSLFRGM